MAVHLLRTKHHSASDWRFARFVNPKACTTKVASNGTLYLYRQRRKETVVRPLHGPGGLRQSVPAGGRQSWREFYSAMPVPKRLFSDHLDFQFQVPHYHAANVHQKCGTRFCRTYALTCHRRSRPRAAIPPGVEPKPTAHGILFDQLHHCADAVAAHAGNAERVRTVGGRHADAVWKRIRKVEAAQRSNSAFSSNGTSKGSMPIQRQ